MILEMICEGFEKGGDSSRRMHIQSTSDIPPKMDVHTKFVYSTKWGGYEKHCVYKPLYERAVGRRNTNKGSLIAKAMR